VTRHDGRVPAPSFAGKLLLATPGMVEPTFARTVILLLAHSTDDGALGLVLNRPSRAPVEAVLPAWAELAAAPGVVFRGGPVDPDALICLGRTSQGWRTVDAEEDPGASGLAGVRLFSAYAGWAPGQLEGEIDAGGWYVLDAEPADPFDTEAASLWRRVLRRQRGPIAFASTAPEDPKHN